MTQANEFNPYAPPTAIEAADDVTPKAGEHSVSGKNLKLAKPLLSFVWDQYRDSLPNSEGLQLPSVMMSTQEKKKRGWVRKTTEDVPVLTTTSIVPNELATFKKHEAELARLSQGTLEGKESSVGTMHTYVWHSVDLDSEGLKPPHIDNKDFSARIQAVYDEMKPHIDGFRDIVERNKEQIEQEQPGRLSHPGDPYGLEGKIDSIDRHMSALSHAVQPETKFSDKAPSNHIIHGDTLGDLLTAANATIPYNIERGYNSHISGDDYKAIKGHMRALIDIVNANQADLNIAAHHALYQQAEHGITGHSKSKSRL